MKPRLHLLLVPLVAASLACSYAYDLLQDSTGLSLNEPPAAEIAPSSDSLDDSQPQTDTDEPPQPRPSNLPSEVRDQMDQIETEVVLLRGLSPTGPVDRGMLSSAELREHVVDDFLLDYTEDEARDDARTLSLLGLMDEDYDLFNLYLDLYSEQVAGFYDDEAGQMFVVGDATFGGPERLTYAHEYAHALQDQTYDLDEGLGFSDDACEANSERCSAVQALLEGDATLLEERWLLTYASEADFQQLRDFYETFESPVYESAPLFLQDDFLFPYQQGYDFVQNFFLDGGWAAVDELYSNPPVSTEQILHPRLYPDEAPVRLAAPELVEALGPGWQEIERDVLGEWYTLLTLREHLPEELAATAAAGWAGDYYLAFYDAGSSEGALVLVASWDTVRDAHEFYDGFREYGNSRFGDRILSSTTQTVWESPGVWAAIEITADQTLWILAPDSGAGTALREAIPFPSD